MPPAEQYRFGPFHLDVAERELRRDGEVVALTAKTFDLLLILVQGAGRTFTKSELLESLWPGNVVEESNLSQTIFLLRKVLAENADAAEYIRTVPRRGYKFIGAVSREALGDNGSVPQAVRETASPPAPPVSAGRALPRWSRIAALAGLVVLATIGVFLWLRTRTSPMTDEDVLVLADFANSTGDPVFDGTLREALAFQLEQSPFLKVLDDRVMRQDLELMQRSPQERITNELARDICIREREKAMLGGAIASFGKSYVLELKATECLTGLTLAREQRDAADKEHVLPALAKAARNMRAKLGESLSSIQKLAPPEEAWAVRTGSLEAFRAFYMGAQLYVQGRYSEAVPTLRRATELDPDFASAWWFLANADYNSGGSVEKYREYNDMAWKLRDRVSAYERLELTTTRQGQTTGEYIQGFETWARTYPRDSFPVINLGRVYRAIGQFEKAVANFQEAYRLQQSHRSAISNVDFMRIHRRLDRFDDAKRVAEVVVQEGGDGPMLHRELLNIAYAEDDQAGVARHIQWFSGKPEEYLSVGAQGAEARVRGQLRRSRELLQHAAELAHLRNQADVAAQFLQPDAGGDALVGRCPPSPRADAVFELKFDYVDYPERDTRDAVLALCASPALVTQAEERNQRWVRGFEVNPAEVPLNRAAAQLGLGRPDQAIALLQALVPVERAYPMSNYIRGLAYLRLRRGVEAGEQFQTILAHRGSNWGPLYPLAFVGLGRAAVLAGDQARARKAYENFFALWRDADWDLPILVQARQEYASLIQ
jgi:DNA-binding winged helix-turn-helix (wHTH) protein/tetratricopeptide (TPR) repeat protein